MRTLVVSLLTLALFACSGNPGGPTLSGRMGPEEPPHPLQSNDILARDQVTPTAKVKHVLISWRDLAEVYSGKMDPRAKARSRWDAEALVKDLYGRLVAGEAIEPMMAEHSEDPGSATSGADYEVFAGSGHVFEFRRLGMRLQVGEVGKVLTQFGWHLMKRVE